MVAFPVAYDAMWVQWYMPRFVGDDPFRRRAINIKTLTLAMVAMGAGYRATAKSSLPKHWRPPARHTHVAVEDAIEQGELFMNIVRELNAQRGDIAPPSSRETEPHRVFARLIRLNHFAVTGLGKRDRSHPRRQCYAAAPGSVTHRPRLGGGILVRPATASPPIACA